MKYGDVQQRPLVCQSQVEIWWFIEFFPGQFCIDVASRPVSVSEHNLVGNVSPLVVRKTDNDPVRRCPSVSSSSSAQVEKLVHMCAGGTGLGWSICVVVHTVHTKSDVFQLEQ